MSCEAPGCTNAATHTLAKSGVALGRVCTERRCCQTIAARASAPAARVEASSVARIAADPTDEAARLEKERRDADFDKMVTTLNQLADLRSQVSLLRPMEMLNKLLPIGDAIDDAVMFDMEELLTRAIKAVLAELNLLVEGEPYDANVGARQVERLRSTIIRRTKLANFDEMTNAFPRLAGMSADLRLAAAVRANPVEIIAQLPSHLPVDVIIRIRSGHIPLVVEKDDIGFEAVGVATRFSGEKATKSTYAPMSFSGSFKFFSYNGRWDASLVPTTQMWIVTSPSRKQFTVPDMHPDSASIMRNVFGFAAAGKYLAVIRKTTNTNVLKAEILEMDAPDKGSAGTTTLVGSATIISTNPIVASNIAVDNNGNIWYINPYGGYSHPMSVTVKSPSDARIALLSNIYPIALAAGPAGMWAAVDLSDGLDQQVVYQYMRLADL